MNIPVFAWDATKKRYVVFPFQELVALHDGSKGIIIDVYPGLMSFVGDSKHELLTRFPDNFRQVFRENVYTRVYKYVPTSPERREKQMKEAMDRINKGKRWYSADQGQIKGYQHPRRRK